MTKIVPCPDCDGRGYFSITGNNSAWSLACDKCGGLGTVEIPVTNADYVRSMSDDELAEFICDKTPECTERACMGWELCNSVDGKANGLKKWLKHPVNKTDF